MRDWLHVESHQEIEIERGWWPIGKVMIQHTTIILQEAEKLSGVMELILIEHERIMINWSCVTLTSSSRSNAIQNILAAIRNAPSHRDMRAQSNPFPFSGWNETWPNPISFQPSVSAEEGNPICDRPTESLDNADLENRIKYRTRGYSTRKFQSKVTLTVRQFVRRYVTKYIFSFFCLSAK